MKILLDTHTFLWFIQGNPALSPTARGLVENSSNQPLLSVASLWEMAIKISLGKLRLGRPFESLIREQLNLNGVEILDHRAVNSSPPPGARASSLQVAK